MAADMSQAPDRSRVHRAIGPQYVSAMEALLAGEPDAVTASRVGVDPAAVPVLLWLAAAKLLDALAPVAGTACPRCGR